MIIVMDSQFKALAQVFELYFAYRTRNGCPIIGISRIRKQTKVFRRQIASEYCRGGEQSVGVGFVNAVDLGE